MIEMWFVLLLLVVGMAGCFSWITILNRRVDLLKDRLFKLEMRQNTVRPIRPPRDPVRDFQVL